MFHIHRFGPIDNKGYQYCLKCGFAHAPPCVHIWENLESYTIERFGRHVANMYIQQCKKCGELRKERIDAC